MDQDDNCTLSLCEMPFESANKSMNLDEKAWGGQHKTLTGGQAASGLYVPAAGCGCADNIPECSSRGVAGPCLLLQLCSASVARRAEVLPSCPCGSMISGSAQAGHGAVGQG